MWRCALAAVLGIVLLPRAAGAYGEPREGSPNHKERLLHVLTNQVRQAPHEWPDWDTSLATPHARGPLALSEDLFAAARFHASDMAANKCFSHESCDGTEFGARLSRYFSGPAGENIYTSVGDDRARRGMTGWMNSDGHRTNILRDEWNLLGTGFAGSGQVYYVQNFGQARSADIPAIVGGAMEDLGGGSLRLIANFYDPGGRGFASFDAVLGQTRVPMAHVVGAPGHQTVQATTAEPADCTPLFFIAEDADGVRTVFPTQGALLVGASCREEYTAERANQIPGEDGPLIIDANDPQGGCRCAAPGASGAAWPALIGLGLLLVPQIRRRPRQGR